MTTRIKKKESIKLSISSHSKHCTRPRTRHLKCFVLNTLSSRTKHLRCIIWCLVRRLWITRNIGHKRQTVWNMYILLNIVHFSKNSNFQEVHNFCFQFWSKSGEILQYRYLFHSNWTLFWEKKRQMCQY